MQGATPKLNIILEVIWHDHQFCGLVVISLFLKTNYSFL